MKVWFIKENRYAFYPKDECINLFKLFDIKGHASWSTDHKFEPDHFLVDIDVVHNVQNNMSLWLCNRKSIVSLAYKEMPLSLKKLPDWLLDRGVEIMNIEDFYAELDRKHVKDLLSLSK